MKKNASKKQTVKSRIKKINEKNNKILPRLKTPLKKFQTKNEKKPYLMMNDFQQCLVLAAIINQERLTDIRFQAIPLPDINSSQFAPLRNIIAKYPFTPLGINQSMSALFKSKVFKDAFPVGFNMLPILPLSEENIVVELLKLAGSEIRKPIYIKAGSKHHDIHKSTLEKFAFETGLISALLSSPEPKKSWEDSLVTHKPEIFASNHSFSIRRSTNYLPNKRGRS